MFLSHLTGFEKRWVLQWSGTRLTINNHSIMFLCTKRLCQQLSLTPTSNSQLHTVTHRHGQMKAKSLSFTYTSLLSHECALSHVQYISSCSLCISHSFTRMHSRSLTDTHAFTVHMHLLFHSYTAMNIQIYFKHIGQTHGYSHICKQASRSWKDFAFY